MSPADDWLKQPVYRALLDDVVANPDDDTPRLVIADWLQEHAGAAGEERSRFIRLQLERARLSPHERRAWELRAEEAPLLAAHQDAWLGRLSKCCSRVEWRRGFVERVAVGVATMAKHAADLFSLTPVYELQIMRLSQSKVTGDDLSKIDALKRIRSLCLRNSSLGDRRVAQFLEVVSLPHLEALDLTGAAVGEGTFKAMQPLAVPKLRSLLIGFNGVRLSWLLPALSGFALEELDLTATVGAAEAETLANWEGLSSVRRLGLSCLPFRTRDCERLFASPHLGPLERLEVNITPIGASGLAALCNSNARMTLRELHLGNANIGKAGVAQLANSGAFPALEYLDLTDNDIDAARVRILARSPVLGRLRHLSLRNNLIGDGGWQALLDCPHLTNLVSLDLALTEPTSSAAAMLAGCGKLASLASLDLAGNGELGEKQLSALLASPTLSRLLKLGTEYLPLGQKFQRSFAGRFPL